MAATPVALEITTSSEEMNFPWPAPSLPKITMNGNPFAAPEQQSIPSGFQLVILDQTKDLTNPSSILVNQCHPLPPDSDDHWETVYPYMYANIVTQMLVTGDPQYQLVFLASYGMDQNAPPTIDALETFLDLGAGAQLQEWVKTADPGSGGGDSWVSIPASYILVGTAGSGYGEQSEVYETYSGSSGTTTLNVTLENGA